MRVDLSIYFYLCLTLEESGTFPLLSLYLPITLIVQSYSGVLAVNEFSSVSKPLVKNYTPSFKSA